MKRLIFFICSIALFTGLAACKETEPKLPKLELNFLKTISWKKKIPCEITYQNGDKTVELKGKIKLRGGFSRKYPKHSFALELKNPYPLGNLTNDDDWILNANYIDKTFMRHKLNYDLFRAMHPNNKAAQSAYINLSIDDKDKGLYVLMEEVNGGMLGVDKKDSMAMVFKDPPLFYTYKLDYVQDSTNYYQQKYPKKKKRDHTLYIESFIDFMFNASDSAFAANIGNWVDLDNIIDWHLILLLSNNGDGVMKNFYFYKINAQTPFRVAIWDYDHAYGREGDYELNMLERAVDCERTILIKRLMAIESTGYKTKLKQRWNTLKTEGLFTQTHLFQMIEKNQAIIEGEIEHNASIWPLDAKWYSDNNSFQAEIDLMKEFISMRLEGLDVYFTDL